RSRTRRATKIFLPCGGASPILSVLISRKTASPTSAVTLSDPKHTFRLRTISQHLMARSTGPMPFNGNGCFTSCGEDSYIILRRPMKFFRQSATADTAQPGRTCCRLFPWLPRHSFALTHYTIPDGTIRYMVKDFWLWLETRHSIFPSTT